MTSTATDTEISELFYVSYFHLLEFVLGSVKEINLL